MRKKPGKIFLAVFLVLSMLTSGIPIMAAEAATEMEIPASETMEASSAAEKESDTVLEAEAPAADVINDNGPSTLADETPDVGSGINGFTANDVYVIPTGTNTFDIIISPASKDYVYGIVYWTGEPQAVQGYDEWITPQDPDSQAYFRNIFEVTSTVMLVSLRKDQQTGITPAEWAARFPGLLVALPTTGQIGRIDLVDPSDVRQYGFVILVDHTKSDQEYMVYNLETNMPASDWKTGTGNSDPLYFELEEQGEYGVVTRFKTDSGHYIIPSPTPALPGAAPITASTSIEKDTGQGLIIITGGETLAYAVTTGGDDPKVLTPSQRTRWGVSARTEEGASVGADTEGFYLFPGNSDALIFTVPPGGTYTIAVRLPNGMVTIPDEAIAVPPALEGINLLIEPGEKTTIPRAFGLIWRVGRVSLYSEYALRSVETGELITAWRRPRFTNAMLLFAPNIFSSDKVELLARPIPLDPTVGSGSNQGGGHLPELAPFVELKETDVTRSSDGKTITVNPAEEGQQYGVFNTDGEQIGDWKDPVNGEVVFSGLDSSTSYVVTMRQFVEEEELYMMQSPGITVPGITSDESGVTNPPQAGDDENSDGQGNTSDGSGVTNPPQTGNDANAGGTGTASGGGSAHAPQTGNDRNAVVWIGMILLSVIGFTLIFKRRKTKCNFR